MSTVGAKPRQGNNSTTNNKYSNTNNRNRNNTNSSNRNNNTNNNTNTSNRSNTKSNNNNNTNTNNHSNQGRSRSSRASPAAGRPSTSRAPSAGRRSQSQGKRSSSARAKLTSFPKATPSSSATSTTELYDKVLSLHQDLLNKIRRVLQHPPSHLIMWPPEQQGPDKTLERDQKRADDDDWRGAGIQFEAFSYEAFHLFKEYCDNLIRHYVSHPFQAPADEAYLCLDPLCPFASATQDEVVKHERTHHRGSLPHRPLSTDVKSAPPNYTGGLGAYTTVFSALIHLRNHLTAPLSGFEGEEGKAIEAVVSNPSRAAFRNYIRSEGINATSHHCIFDVWEKLTKTALFLSYPLDNGDPVSTGTISAIRTGDGSGPLRYQPLLPYIIRAPAFGRIYTFYVDNWGGIASELPMAIPVGQVTGLVTTIGVICYKNNRFTYYGRVNGLWQTHSESGLAKLAQPPLSDVTMVMLQLTAATPRLESPADGFAQSMCPTEPRMGGSPS